MTRELRLALGLVLLGSAVLLVAAGRPWVQEVLAQPAPLPPRSVVRTGSDVVPGARALGLLGLAGVAALAATRRRGRVAVGVVLAVAGVAAAVAVAVALRAGAAAALAERGTSPAQPGLGFTGWPAASLAGAVLLAAGGLLVAVRGPRWAALSSRYDAPAARAARPPARPEVAAWEALDRGEDPTAPEDAAPPPPEARPAAANPAAGPSGPRPAAGPERP